MSSGSNWVKEREFKFNGDPVTFKRVVSRFTSARFRITRTAGERWNYFYDDENDTVTVEFWPPDKGKYGWGEAIPAPGGKAFIRAYARPREWPAVSGTWELLEEELRRQGWLESADMPGAVARVLANREPTEREKKKQYVLSQYLAGRTLTKIADRDPYYIPYSTVRRYYNQLIEEGLLPPEVKRKRKKANPDSI